MRYGLLITMAMVVPACADDPGAQAPVTGSQTSDIAYANRACGFTNYQEGWQNSLLPQHSGAFDFTFYVVPGDQEHRPIDAVFGLSDGKAAAFSDLGPIVRFNANGFIDARDGSSYRAIAAVPYQSEANTDPYVRYFIRMAGDIRTHRYSVWVTREGGSEVQVANNFAFRTEQSGMTRVGYLGGYVDGGYGGTFYCDGYLFPPEWVRSDVNSGWANTAFPVESGHWDIYIDAWPQSANLDAVVGLTHGAATTYSKLAAIVRFNPSGYVDARDGGTYRAYQSVPYRAGYQYTLWFDVDTTAGTYTAAVIYPDGSDHYVAYDYAFRTEQTGITAFDTIGQKVDSGDSYVLTGNVMSEPWPYP